MMDIACDALVLPPDDAPVAPAFRRRAAARGPGHGPAGKARPAAAGRADQPSRRRNDPVARTDAPRVSGHGDHRHPRPLLPRQHHQVDPGAGERPRPALRGQLLVLARPEGRTAADHREEGDPAAEDAATRIGVDPQVAPGPPAEERGPRQGLRAIGQPADRPDERDDHPDRARPAAGREGAAVPRTSRKGFRSRRRALEPASRIARSTCRAGRSSA